MRIATACISIGEKLLTLFIRVFPRARARAHVHDISIFCHGGMYISFLYVKLDLRLVIMLPAYACSMFASLPRTPYAVPAAGHVPTPGPPDQCSRRQNTCCSGASHTETDTGDGLCSTEQAPKSLDLCCHSLPLGGRSRPFRGRVANPMVRPIVSVGSGSGNGAWAGMLRGTG